MTRAVLAYDQARSALQRARNVDEAKKIRDAAEALLVYARQREDPQMERWLAEIRVRGSRRIGEITANLPKSAGGRPGKNSAKAGGVSTKEAVLRKAKITHQDASRCEKIAEIPEAEFESALAKSKDPTTGKDLLRKVGRKRRRKERIDHILKRSEGSQRLDSMRAFPLLYADPPWEYDFSRSDSRSLQNQYPTMSLEAICALQIPAAEEAILFLWSTSPKLPEALEVVAAWGFRYQTCLVWVKDKIGMGYYARQRHELLLVATRGAWPPPEEMDRPDSVVEAPRGQHSEKPEKFYELIEKLYPQFDGKARVELFQRKPRIGWQGWGFEA